MPIRYQYGLSVAYTSFEQIIGAGEGSRPVRSSKAG